VPAQRLPRADAEAKVLAMRIRAYLFASLSVAVVACGGSKKEAAGPSGPTPGTEGVAVLEPRSGSAVTGEARFVDTGTGVEVSVNVAGATPGKHGVHVHEIGDCIAPDATSAGEHFNPGSHQHGAPGGADHHIGDFGNLEVGEDGTGTLTLVIEGATLAPGHKSFADRALVIHAQEDDFQTQPSGNSGDRIACGVIRVQEKPAP
jgi:Cu-Zn family superoxide dismutase